jgi:3-oxoacyl-[acyl-carrier-protein] synthase II
MPGGGLDPDGAGTEVAITAALDEAGITPGEVGHVNAHGSGTRVSDLAEARALRRVFGLRGVPVAAFKGYLGNLVSGAGAVEMIASLQAVHRGKVPAILNCEHPDPECEVDLIVKAPRPCRNPLFVNTNVTPLGQAAALVVRGHPAASNPAAS